MKTRDTATEIPSLLTITQAGRFLGVSRSTIYRMIGEGTLRVCRPVPDAPRLRRVDLEALVADLGRNPGAIRERGTV